MLLAEWSIKPAAVTLKINVASAPSLRLSADYAFFSVKPRFIGLLLYGGILGVSVLQLLRLDVT